MRSILEELFYGNICPNTDCRNHDKEGKIMNIQQFWSDVLAQRADEIREYFHTDAYVNWHFSGEHFTVEE